MIITNVPIELSDCVDFPACEDSFAGERGKGETMRLVLADESVVALQEASDFKGTDRHRITLSRRFFGESKRLRCD
jgi:hypothetical protein